jgi:hypothetical protein
VCGQPPRSRTVIGSEEPWSFVRHLDAEPTVVHETVVASAEKDEVVDARRAAVRPMISMMRVAPARRSITAGEGAPAVANRDRPSKRGRHHLGVPSDVERLGGGTGDDAAHGGVTCELPGGLAVDPSDVFQVEPTAGTPLERGDIHRHHHVGALTGNQRTLSEVEPLPADLTERVRTALGGSAGIFGARSLT